MNADASAVRRATAADAEAVTHVLATAFMKDPVSCWIFPDQTDRARLHPRFFRPFVDLALEAGEVHVAGDVAGVSLWLPVDPSAPADDDGELAATMEAGIGPEYTKRFAVLDELMTVNHPGDRDHAYLPFIAVDPARHSTGFGTALLRHRLAQLDAAGVPAYLEASHPRNQALYARLGFQPMPNTVDLPDGPRLQPMWRDPA